MNLERSRDVPSALSRDGSFRSVRRRARSGMTLVEVMLGFVIMGTAALAALSALLFGWRVADANLRALSAMEAARSVSEQILTLDFDTLGGVALPVDVPSSTLGSLTVGVWNNRTDDIHNTPSNLADDLVLSIKPEVRMSSDDNPVKCVQVIVRFSWEENSFFAKRTREDAITIVRSPLTNY